MAHELGHLCCGHLGSAPKDRWPDRTKVPHEQSEFEAETTAQVAFRRIAPEATLPEHLGQYGQRESPRLDGDWGGIMAAATRIIDMCQGDSPRRR